MILYPPRSGVRIEDFCRARKLDRYGLGNRPFFARTRRATKRAINSAPPFITAAATANGTTRYGTISAVGTIVARVDPLLIGTMLTLKVVDITAVHTAALTPALTARFF